MRLLFISNFYPPNDLGGWEQFCHEITNVLIERGHEVYVLTSRYKRKDIPAPEPHIFRDLFLESAVDYYRPVSDFLGMFYRSRYNNQRLDALVKSVNPDAILIWGMMDISPAVAVKAEEISDGRVGYYLCGYWPIEQNTHESYWSKPTNNELLAAFSKPIAKIVYWKTKRGRLRKPSFEKTAAVSNEVINILRQNGIQLEDPKVIYGGIRIEDFYTERNSVPSKNHLPRRLVYVGTLSKNKGVDTLMEAMVLASKRYSSSQLSLTVIGNGHNDFNQWLFRFIEENALSSYVDLKGWMSREQISKFLARSDVFVFPSVWEEPLARAMMEGMAAGLTLISTTTGGSKEFLLDNNNALTFSAGNADELASRIAYVVENPEMAARIAKSGQNTAVTHFDFDRMANELESFAREVAQL